MSVVTAEGLEAVAVRLGELQDEWTAAWGSTVPESLADIWCTALAAVRGSVRFLAAVQDYRVEFTAEASGREDDKHAASDLESAVDKLLTARLRAHTSKTSSCTLRLSSGPASDDSSNVEFGNRSVPSWLRSLQSPSHASSQRKSTETFDVSSRDPERRAADLFKRHRQLRSGGLQSLLIRMHRKLRSLVEGEVDSMIAAAAVAWHDEEGPSEPASASTAASPLGRYEMIRRRASAMRAREARRRASELLGAAGRRKIAVVMQRAETHLGHIWECVMDPWPERALGQESEQEIRDGLEPKKCSADAQHTVAFEMHAGESEDEAHVEDRCGHDVIMDHAMLGVTLPASLQVGNPSCRATEPPLPVTQSWPGLRPAWMRDIVQAEASNLQMTINRQDAMNSRESWTPPAQEEPIEDCGLRSVQSEQDPGSHLQQLAQVPRLGNQSEESSTPATQEEPIEDCALRKLNLGQDGSSHGEQLAPQPSLGDCTSATFLILDTDNCGIATQGDETLSFSGGIDELTVEQAVEGPMAGIVYEAEESLRCSETTIQTPSPREHEIDGHAVDDGVEQEEETQPYTFAVEPVPRIHETGQGGRALVAERDSCCSAITIPVSRTHETGEIGRALVAERESWCSAISSDTQVPGLATISAPPRPTAFPPASGSADAMLETQIPSTGPCTALTAVEPEFCEAPSEEAAPADPADIDEIENSCAEDAASMREITVRHAVEESACIVVRLQDTAMTVRCLRAAVATALIGSSEELSGVRIVAKMANGYGFRSLPDAEQLGDRRDFATTCSALRNAQWRQS